MDIINRLMEILESKSEILIVGLRVGEKIKEELWSSQESILQTKMEGIKALNLVVNKQIPIDYEENPLTDKKAIAEINRFLMGSKVGM